MGFLFGKKKTQQTTKEAEPAAAKTTSRTAASQASRGTSSAARQSRRVVAAPVVKPSPAKPVVVASPDDLALPEAPVAAPKVAKPITTSVAKGQGTQPIAQSAPPAFAGSLTTGPVRTGDAALADFLVTQAKLLTAEQVAAARTKAQAEQLPLDAALIAQGAVTGEAMLNAMSQARYFPHLQLDRYTIRKKALDTVAREDALRLSVIPVDKLGSLLQLAMVNPLDEETVNLIHARTGLEVKRCIATRAELERAIEKWYGGQAQAQDTSLSFVADPGQETKSLTQVLANVPVAAPVPEALPSLEATTTQVSVTSSQRLTIAAEIQDIDDLLSADDAIAPAIVEPIQLDEAPLIVPAEEVLEAAAPVAAPTALEPRPAKPAEAETPSPSRSSSASGRGQVYVQLIPVLEDEFQHAVTHNKAHVFERWIGLQTRNRIINAVPVDEPVEALLAGALHAA